MKTNTGIPYELLTKRIFQSILDQDSVRNIAVEHNVLVQGKILRHQIDILWAYETGGIVYTTVVQAKDWRTPVTQEQLLTFKSVLDDIPGQPRGVFVTRTGYQAGAKKYAQAEGIMIYELKDAVRPALVSEEKPLRLNLNCYIPLAHDVEFIFDKEWLKAEKRRIGIPDRDQFEVGFIQDSNNEVLLYDEGGALLCNMAKILNQMHDYAFEIREPKETVYTFKQPTFVKTDRAGFPRVKVEGIKATIEVRRESQALVFEPSDFIRYILRNVSDDSCRRFNSDAMELK